MGATPINGGPAGVRMRERPGALPKRNPAQKSSSAAASERQTCNFEPKWRRTGLGAVAAPSERRLESRGSAFRLVDMTDRRPSGPADRRPDRSSHHSAGDRPSRGLLLDRVSASGKSQARNAQDEDGGDADRKTGHQAENSLKWLSLQRDRRH